MKTPPWFRWALLFGVWLLYTAFGLIVTSMAPLVGLVESDLQLTHAQMGTTMGAWQLVYIVSAIPCGILLDKLGPRWALTLGGIVISASIFARSIASNFTELLIAVMLFGIGGPIISSGAPKVVAQWFTGSSRGLAMGVYMTGPAIGGIVSLTMSHSILLPYFDNSWRSVMMLWAGVSIVISIIWLLICSYPGLKVEKPLPADTIPESQLSILGKLIKQPAVLLVLFMSVGVFLFNHGLSNWLPELLHNGGMTVINAGYWAAIPTMIGLAGSLLIPRLATPERRFNILMVLSLCAAGASVLLHYQSEPLLFTGLVLQGIARSALMTVLVLTLVELPGIGERYVGVASGLFFSAAEVGGVLGPVTMGLLYDITNGFDAGLYLLTATAIALAFGAKRLKTIASH